MEQLRFENEFYLYGLLLVPLLMGLFFLMQYRRKKALREWGNERTVKQLMPDISRFKRPLKLGLLAVALAFLCLGMANLQYGSKKKEVERKGLDVMIALDLSKSMLAEDINPNRLQKAKLFIREMLTELTNDRIGLIIFGGNAYVQMPLTSDYAAASIFLNSLSTQMVPTQGTAIGDAIDLGRESFEQEQEQYKTMVIISDGENHQGDAVKAAKAANEANITVNTIGVGSEEGSPIPVKRNGEKVDFLRDQEGEVVVSKMNPSIVENIAQNGGGEYFRLQDIRETVKGLMNAIEKMEKRKIDTKVYTDYTDHFQYFLGAALLLMIVEFVITERKSRLMEKIGV